MGSTNQSAQVTKSTYVSPTALFGFQPMTAVTSSGVYFDVGDVSQVVVLVGNASSSDTGAIWVEPGKNWAGAVGTRLGVSTTSTLYSTATAPIALSFVTPGITGSSAIMSTAASVGLLYLESAMVKSSDTKIYIVASTGSTKMYCNVYALPGGSTN